MAQPMHFSRYLGGSIGASSSVQLWANHGTPSLMDITKNYLTVTQTVNPECFNDSEVQIQSLATFDKDASQQMGVDFLGPL